MWENTFFVFAGILANSATLLSVLVPGLSTLVINHKSFHAGGFSKQMKCLLLNTGNKFSTLSPTTSNKKLLP
jgi:hypothetical protein